MDSRSPDVSSPTRPSTDAERPPKRRKTAIACQNCRSRKVRCDGVRPVCRTCTNRGQTDTCTYVGNVTEGQDDSLQYIESLKKRLQTYEGKCEDAQADAGCESPSPFRNPQSGNWQDNPFGGHEAREIASSDYNLRNTICRTSNYNSDDRVLTSADGPSSSAHNNADRRLSQPPLSRSAIKDLVKQGYLGDSSSASFMNNLRRTVKARNTLDDGNQAGHPLPHLTLAELGPKPDLTASTPHDDSLALPPRHIANSLMDTYWQNYYPLYPVVDCGSFQSSYEAIWAGGNLGSAEGMTHCILNLMFALASQSLRPGQSGFPNPQQTPYFSRARNLMRRNLLTGWSFQLVQALILYAQYLQSLDDPHQCWTVIGMATRMAESMGLHIGSTSRNLKACSERELARRVWHCCVTLDRIASMVLGRTPAISLASANAVDRPSIDDSIPKCDSGVSSTNSYASHPKLDTFVHSLPLFDILHQILLTFYAPSQSLDRSHISGQISRVMDFESCLQDWIQSLPQHLQFNPEIANPSRIQTSLLKLRYANVRLLLYRPILSFTILKPVKREFLPRDLPARAAALLASSKACVEAALVIANFTYDNISLDASSSATLTSPWWYNVCYSYTAATTILAARGNSSLMTEIGISTLDHGMKQCISVLEHFKQIVPSATHCLAALSHIALEIEPNIMEQTYRNTDGNESAQQVDSTAEQHITDYPEGGFVDTSWLDSVAFDLIPDHWIQPQELLIATTNI